MSYYHTISVNSGISAICAASLSPLSREEEKKIIKLAKKGNKKAKDTLFRSNLRYVTAIAKKYQNKGLEFDELVVEGYLALEDSLRKFSVEKDIKFITFAKWDILNSIPKAINDCGYTIRQSRHNLSAAIKNRTNFLSLDACADSDDEENLLSHISDDRIFSPEDEALRSLTKEKVWEVLGNLPQINREIVILHHGLAKTQKEYSFSEIGAMYKRTKQWAFNKYSQSVSILKEELKEVA
jgi:RNA polymerase primary sigma factor